MLKDSFEFYYKASKLKDMLRQGAVQWNVNKDRRESVAEHVYGCMILAVSLYSELELNIDLKNVLEMLTIHEFEELAIGDITPLDNVDSCAEQKRARIFVKKLLKNLKYGFKLISLTEDFNNIKSEEAKFAKAVDKLECVLEFKKYEDLGYVSLKNVTPKMLENKILKEFVDQNKYDLCDIFFIYHKPYFEYLGIDEDYWFNVLKPLNIVEK